MRILFVVDQYLHSNNGTTITARRFARELMARGHEVRVACQADAPAPGSAAPGDAATGADPTAAGCVRADDGVLVYPQPELRIPVFQGLVDRQGMTLARADRASMARALAWCDVVHFFMPFSLAHTGVLMARQLGVPATAAFHVQPQNLSSSVGLGRSRRFNDMLFRAFDWSLYWHVDHVHCPSNMIASQLREHGYANTLHVISNGIEDSFCYRREPKPAELAGRVVVTMVGRYSREKRQDVVIRGVAASRHREKIVLVLAGQGPTERRLRQLAARLGVDARFGFMPQPRLRDVLAQTDVYVHASDMEAEAMSCMEAFATGLVPIIADSPLSATPQFALDDRSLFAAGDPQDLARHLDWWIEHPQERERMGHAYAREAEGYRIGARVERFERMLRQAVANAPAPRGTLPPDSAHVSDERPTHVVHMRHWGSFTTPDGYDYLRLGRGATAGYWAFRVVLDIAAWLATRVVLGVRVRGRRNLQAVRGGFVSVSNHVQTLDCGMALRALRGRRTYFVSLEENFALAWVGGIVRLAGAVPVPRRPRQFVQQVRALTQALARGGVVHVYPEGALLPYAEGLRPFATGAFHLAVRAGVPVVPMVIRQAPRRGLGRLLHRRPRLTLTVLPPLWTDPTLPRAQAVPELADRCWRVMDRALRQGGDGL